MGGKAVAGCLQPVMQAKAGTQKSLIFAQQKATQKNATLTEVLQKPLQYSQYSANRRQYQYRYNA